MANVNASPPPSDHSCIRILVAAVLILTSAFGWSDLRLNYVTISRDRDPIELSNQYNIRYLGSSIGSTMASNKSRSPISAFFRDERTQGSLQIEYTLSKNGEESRHSMGIYEKYATNEDSFLRPSRSVSGEYLSIVNTGFKTGPLSTDDELYLTVTLASYSSEIALGMDTFVQRAGLRNVGTGDYAEMRLALASTAIAAFSRNGSTVSIKTVGLPERELRKSAHIVFYLADDDFDASDFANSLGTTERQWVGRSFGEGWYGNVVFRVEREVLPCEVNTREESVRKCDAVTRFMKEWLHHRAGDLPSSGDRSFGWRVAGEAEERGQLSEFLDKFDLSRWIGDYSNQHDDTWSAKGAIWVDGQSGEGKGRCTKDMEVHFVFEPSESTIEPPFELPPYMISGAEIAIGEFEMDDGNRPSDLLADYQCIETETRGH